MGASTLGRLINLAADQGGLAEDAGRVVLSYLGYHVSLI